jgi:RING finger protein 170
MTCPMCRQGVSCLLPLYTRSEEERNIPEFNETFRLLKQYNKRFSGEPRSLMDYLSDLPILLRHAINELFTLDALSMWYRIRVMFLIFVGFFYLVSPFDILPEAVFGVFGFIDDVLLFFFLAIYITIIYRNIVANRR